MLSHIANLQMRVHVCPETSRPSPMLTHVDHVLPLPPQDPGTNRLYVCDTEGWPKHMHLRYEHFETELPFNRAPLYDHIDVLAQQLAASSRGSGSGSHTPGGRQQGGPPNPAAAPPPPNPSPPANKAAPSEPAGGSGRASGRQSPSCRPSSPGGPATQPSQTGLSQTCPVPKEGSIAAPEQGELVQQPPQQLPQATTASQLPASLSAILSESQPPMPSLLRDVRIADLHPASW